MDDLDAMIVREIVWRPTDPHHAARGLRRPWDIARALGLHGTTVKRRIAELREEGSIRGIYVQPAPALVGVRASEQHFTFRSAAEKRRAYGSILADPAVWEAYEVVGDQVIAVVATPLDADVLDAGSRIARESGAIGHRLHHVWHWDVPVERVSALDLRILAALADEAFRSVGDVAADVGIGPKTVTARMRALARMGAFLVHPHSDYQRMNGGMTVYLDMGIELGATDTVHVEIANRFPLAFCRSARGGENGYAVLHAPDAGALEAMLSRAESIPGVTSVQPRILHSSHLEAARWKDALLQRAQALASAKGIWAPWRAKPDPSAPRAASASMPSSRGTRAPG